jgi:hypothetical protein
MALENHKTIKKNNNQLINKCNASCEQFVRFIAEKTENSNVHNYSTTQF